MPMKQVLKEHVFCLHIKIVYIGITFVYIHHVFILCFLLGSTFTGSHRHEPGHDRREDRDSAADAVKIEVCSLWPLMRADLICPFLFVYLI